MEQQQGSAEAPKEIPEDSHLHDEGEEPVKTAGGPDREEAKEETSDDATE